MVRRSVYLGLNGMGSGYFLYDEDLDFCWRCRLTSYYDVYVLSTVAYHVGKHATQELPYYAIYFGRRNRLFNVFTNYSLPLSLLCSMILAPLYVITIPYVAVRRDRVKSRIMVEVLVSMVRHLRYLVRRRKFISRIRRVSDFDLVKRGR